MKCQLILTFIVGNFEGHCLKSVSSISVTSISRKMVNRCLQNIHHHAWFLLGKRCTILYSFQGSLWTTFWNYYKSLVLTLLTRSTSQCWVPHQFLWLGVLSVMSHNFRGSFVASSSLFQKIRLYASVLQIESWDHEKLVGNTKNNLRTEINIDIEKTSNNKSRSLFFILFSLRYSSLTQGTNLINKRRHHFWSSLTRFRSNLSLCEIPRRWQVHNLWRSWNSNDILFFRLLDLW